MTDTDRDARAIGLAMRRRALLAAIPGALASPAALAQAAPRKGGTLRVVGSTNPSSLDPATGGAGSDHVFLYTMHDTLVEFDFETLKAMPGLAESWSNPDPTTLVLKLRRDVVFHDGTPFDAAAVKFNLDRGMTDARSNIKGDLATVASVEASGPLEVTIRLKEADSALPLILSDRAGMICSPKAIQELGKEHDRKPVGTGAWRIAAWNDNEKIVVVRNERYWKPGRPYVDGIEFAIIPEVNTGLRSVVAGQNDFVYFLSPQQKPVVERARNLVAVSGPTLYCVTVFLNFGRPPFDDVRVRRAINHAVDRESFAKATMAGLSEVATTVLPRAHWAYDKSLDGFYKHDPDMARRLLAEAGHKDGIDIHLIGYTDQRQQQRQEVLAEQLRQAGIRLKFSLASIAEGSAQFFAKKEGAGLVSQWTGRPDPSLSFTLLYGKNAYFNASRIEATPEIGPALAETRASGDIAERTKAFARLQRIVVEQALSVPLAFQFELDAHVAKVKGFRSNLLGKPKFGDVWLES